MATILIVEDDKNIRALTKARLKSFHTIIEAADGEEAIDVFYKQHIDLIVSDVMMPNIDGYELVRTLREYNHNVPVILLTAKTSFEDKREGFSTGIDDYMTKPVDYEELLWRIDALLRRAGINASNKIKIGNATIDVATYTVSDDNHTIELAKKEFDLLHKLASYPNVIFTKEQLLEEIWGLDSNSDENTVKTHISRLRSNTASFSQFEITTVRGLGYKLVF